jgi:hypothetical protein
MKFHMGQYVTRNDSPGVGVLGRVIGTSNFGLDSTVEVSVRWFNGHSGDYSEAQLRIVCPDCAKLGPFFDKEQLKQLKQECDICR